LILAEVTSTSNDDRAIYEGVVLAIAVHAEFNINRTMGVPNAIKEISDWGEPLGLASLFLEAITV
jgi:hypothetical protein